MLIRRWKRPFERGPRPDFKGDPDAAGTVHRTKRRQAYCSVLCKGPPPPTMTGNTDACRWTISVSYMLGNAVIPLPYFYGLAVLPILSTSILLRTILSPKVPGFPRKEILCRNIIRSMKTERQKARVDPMYHEKIDGLIDRYARKLAENLNERNVIDARCPLF